MRRICLPCGCQEVTLPGEAPSIAQHCDRHRQELPTIQLCGCIVTRKVGHINTKLCATHRQQEAQAAVLAVRAGIAPKPDWDDL